MEYNRLNKKAIGSMYLSSFIGTTIVITILIALQRFVVPKDLPILHYVIWGITALLLLNFLIGPFFRYNRYAYLIHEEYIDVKEGFIFIERQIVPIERIHNIEISKGPISRIFGLSEVKVTTAGSSVSISFLEDKKAESIVDLLQKRINTVAREKKLEKQEQASDIKED